MDNYTNLKGVPDFTSRELRGVCSEYALCIPVINEGTRILDELKRAKDNDVDKLVDIIICDGGSTDSSLSNEELLKDLGVNTVLVKTGYGKQGAQLRMGFYYCLQRGYKGIITVDGNNKDSIEDVYKFVDKLKEGYDFVQGSRFIQGGNGINTPLYRDLAVRLIHAPTISKVAKEKFTDTTNAFRGYSIKYLTDERVQPLREVFAGYELLAYLSVRASELGLKTCEVPVTRRYPKNQKVPTKISFVKGNMDLLKILNNVKKHKYNPE